VNSNHDDSSMPDKLNRQGRQMTLRESDDRIVPLKRKIQLRGSKPGNAGAGKAVRISRGPDRTPAVLSDGLSVLIRLGRIVVGQFGTVNKWYRVSISHAFQHRGYDTSLLILPGDQRRQVKSGSRMR
jgi:hypothetical protein